MSCITLKYFAEWKTGAQFFLKGLHVSGKMNTLLTPKWSSKWEEMLVENSRREEREWENPIPVLNRKPEFAQYHTGDKQYSDTAVAALVPPSYCAYKLSEKYCNVKDRRWAGADPGDPCAQIQTHLFYIFSHSFFSGAVRGGNILTQGRSTSVIILPSYRKHFSQQAGKT